MPFTNPENLIKLFLDAHNLKGENFNGTPKRVATFWKEFLNPPKPRVKTFPLRTKPGMIIHRGIVLWGFCPHHLLPIKYTFKIGYIPKKRPLGASKPTRIIQGLLTQLPLQEELPQMIVEALEKVGIIGGGCIVKGEHLCMQMRGIKQSCADMLTDYLSGCFLEDQATREEFMLL